MNTYGCITEEWFNKVRLEFNNELNEFDKGCIPSVIMINQLDNIATKFCCSGHPNKLSQANLTLVVKDNPDLLLTRYGEWVDSTDPELIMMIRPRLSMIKLKYLDPRIVRVSFNSFYWAWRITFGPESSNLNPILLDVIKEVMEEFSYYLLHGKSRDQ